MINLNKTEIESLLPHRDPMLLIDELHDIKKLTSATGIVNVKKDSFFVQGHFPNQPVMPGVLVLEAMCQAGCFLVLNSVDNPMEKNMFFSSLSDSRFRHPIIPGDQIRLEMILVKFRLGTALLEGKAYVDDKLVAEGKLKATVVDRLGV